MKRLFTVGVAVLATSGLFGVPAYSQEQQPATETQQTAEGQNVSQEKGEEGGSAAVAHAGRAMELVQYARDYESPVAMLAAVQMLRDVSLRDGADRIGQGETEAVEGEADGQAQEKGETPAPTADIRALLEEARAWASGDEHVTALIEKELAKPVQQGGTLGSTTGPIVHNGRIDARSRLTYQVTFQAGELARVAVVGDGDTDLDLYIFDQNGNLIVQDIDFSDRCLVEWTPRWTGTFYIRIVNRGSVYNRFVLMTN